MAVAAEEEALAANIIIIVVVAFVAAATWFVFVFICLNCNNQLWPVKRQSGKTSGQHQLKRNCYLVHSGYACM